MGAARGTATETIRSAARGAATLEAAIVLPLLLCAFSLLYSGQNGLYLQPYTACYIRDSNGDSIRRIYISYQQG